MSETTFTKPYDPTDESGEFDHLSPAVTKEPLVTQRRTERRAATASQVMVAIKAHGNNYASAGEQLRNAAKRHFGSWAQACRAAGLQPPKEKHG